MSVIINELEVVAPAERPAPAGVIAPDRVPEPAGPTPFEFRAVMRHLAGRSDRVRAD